MRITERQREILNSIVSDYINLAQPISSEFLERKHNFGISSATIRIEMQKLTDKGFLYQPYTSAGRIPTDKGYRFFVDSLLEKEIKEFNIEEWLEIEIEDQIKFIQNLTRNLAKISKTLVLGYLEKEKILWKEGWEGILKEPEFKEKDFLISFVEFLEDFEKAIEDFEINSGIKIYIGRENPFKKVEDFSIISSRCSLPSDGETIISLLGPKRMAYDRNISLINSLKKILEEF